MDGLLDLLRKYVDQNSNVDTIEWDDRVSIPLLFNPHDSTEEGRRFSAHYFTNAQAHDPDMRVLN